MSEEFRLGLSDRIAIAGIIGGFAGTLAAMALPLAYPDLPIWAWRLVFWPSLLTMLSAMGFLGFDLIVRPRLDVGLRLRRIGLGIGAVLIAILVVSGVWYWGFLVSMSNRPLSPSASITVLQTEMVPNPRSYPDFFAANIYTRNNGSAKRLSEHFAYSWTRYSSTEEIPEKALDNYAMNLLSDLKSMRYPIQNNEVDIGKGEMFSAYNNERRLYDLNRKGDGSLYLLMFFEYKDEFLPKDKWRVTEFCWRVYPDDSMPRCPNHNYGYVRD